MNAREKIHPAGLAVVLLIGATLTQRGLNHDREALGLTRVAPLENAPPLLAFTTVALGGFRGLIANALWIRATEMQEEDKFFEMAQLADWITAGAAFCAGLDGAGVEHVLQHFREVQGFRRSLALGAARHLAAAG